MFNWTVTLNFLIFESAVIYNVSSQFLTVNLFEITKLSSGQIEYVTQIFPSDVRYFYKIFFVKFGGNELLIIVELTFFMESW